MMWVHEAVNHLREGTLLVTGEKDNNELFGLVELAVAGDVAAFEKLYRTQAQSILYHARSIMHSSADAEDAAQEAVIAMFRGIGSLRDPKAFLPWMHRLIKFVCLKQIRKLKGIQDRQETVDIGECADTLEDSSKGTDVAGVLEEREQNRAIMRVLEGLPDKQRETVVLYYFDELSYKEIAEVMGITMSTVSTNIMKAKKKIKKELELGIAVAIKADAASKYPAIAVERFSHICDGGIRDVLVQAGQSASASAPATVSGHAASHSFGHIASLKIAAIITSLTVVVTGGVLVVTQPGAGEILAGNAPDVAQATATIDRGDGVYDPDIEIALTGGDCECGHVNPKAAVAVIGDDGGGSITGWKIVSRADSSVAANGDGDTIGSVFQSLPPGEYDVVFEISNPGVGHATASREIDIIPGEISPGSYM